MRYNLAGVKALEVIVDALGSDIATPTQSPGRLDPIYAIYTSGRSFGPPCSVALEMNMSRLSALSPPPVSRRSTGLDLTANSAGGHSGAKVNFRPTPPTSLADAGLTETYVDAIIFKSLLSVGSASARK